MSKEILEQTRKEFKINTREWEHLCFEGSYVPEIVEYALSVQKAEIRKKLLLKLEQINKHGCQMDKQDIEECFKEEK
jgi:hypothetical protein